jgi:hypothetical protein
MSRLRTNCVQTVRRWGQKSVGKLPQLPHLFSIQPQMHASSWENSQTFTSPGTFVSQVFPHRIVFPEQMNFPYFYTSSTLPITTTTIYI